MHRCLGVVSPIVVLIVVATIVYTSGKDDRFQKEKARLVATSVYASMLLLWPVVVDVLVGWDAVKEYKYLMIGFVWTSILLLYEMTINMKEHESSKTDASIRSQSTRQFASITIGAAWAVGSLLAAIGGGGFQNRSEAPVAVARALHRLHVPRRRYGSQKLHGQFSSRSGPSCTTAWASSF